VEAAAMAKAYAEADEESEEESEEEYEPPPAKAAGQTFAIGSSVLVKRSNGEESPAIIHEYDAARKVYKLELGAKGSGQFKQAPETHIRASKAKDPSLSSASLAPSAPSTTSGPHVSNLSLRGDAMTGSTLTATGTWGGATAPTAKWFRVTARGAKSEISGARSLSYSPTADDLGCALCCECVGPQGGAPVGVTSATVRIDAASASELVRLKSKKSVEKEMSVQPVPAVSGESRTLAISSKTVKLSKKSGKKTATVWEHDFSKGLSVRLAADETSFTVQLDASGRESTTLAAAHRAERDTIVYLLRELRGHVLGRE